MKIHQSDIILEVTFTIVSISLKKMHKGGLITKLQHILPGTISHFLKFINYFFVRSGRCYL